MAQIRSSYFERRYGEVPGARDLKLILAELDGGMACVYCGARRSLTVDHVVPESRLAEFGVSVSEPNNKVIACLACNEAKHDMTPAEAGFTFQPWVRRRTWLTTHYDGRPLAVRTPNGVVVDPERTARERKARSGLHLGEGSSPGASRPTSGSSTRSRKKDRRRAEQRRLLAGK